MNTIFKTKGIVVKTVKYGDTSIIASIYTELFGIQSYIIKGARKPISKGSSKASYFLPSTILEIQTQHNELKNLQFIKDYQYSKLYISIPFDVVKNAVAMFCVELLQHSIKQPENNPELFYFLENIFLNLDATNNSTLIANLPIFFSIKLAEHLGFGIHKNYSDLANIFDLQQGIFVQEIPLHHYHISANYAPIFNQLILIESINDIATIKLNQNTRRQLLDYLIQYYLLHISNFTSMRSIEILREVL